MKIGEKIKQLRENHGLRQEDLAEIAHVSKTAVSAWETMGKIPRAGAVERMAQYFHIPKSEILCPDEKSPEGDTLFSQHPEIFRPKMRKVPLLGKTACGEPIYSPNFDNGFALINSDILADFALEAQGESMSGIGIHSGDVIFFVAVDMVDNGQIAAVVVGEEVTLKRVYYYPDNNKLILNSENPAFEPLVYIGAELDEIRIIGRAIAQLRKL